MQEDHSNAKDEEILSENEEDSRGSDVPYDSDGSYQYSEGDEDGNEEEGTGTPSLPVLDPSMSEQSGTESLPPYSPTLQNNPSCMSDDDLQIASRSLDVCTQDIDELNKVLDGVKGSLWQAANSVVLTFAMEPRRFLLDSERATAWGLEPTMPIVFQLEMDVNYTNSVNPAKVIHAFQTPDSICPKKRHFNPKVGFGLAWVLQDRLQGYVKESWPGYLLREEKNTDEDVKDLRECCCVDHELAEFALKEHKYNKMDALQALTEESSKRKLVQSLMEQNNKRLAAMPSIPPAPKSADIASVFITSVPSFDSETKQKTWCDDAIARLMELKPGLSVEEANALLEQFGGDVERAAQGIFDSSGQEEVKMEEPPSLPILRNEKSSILAHNMELLRDNEVPYCLKNYLVSIVHFVEDKMRTVNLRCLICDEDLKYKGLTPVVCQRELCIHGYEQYSLGIDLDSKIMNHPEVADLLISMFYSAVQGGRLDLEMDGQNNTTFPEQVRIGEEDFLKPTSDTSKKIYDLAKLKNVLNLLPGVGDLKEWAHAGILRTQLDGLHVLLYPLLRWIMASNRSHIRLLSPTERIREIECVDQFLLMTGPVEKELQFQKLKQETKKLGEQRYGSFGKNGSIYAFHGSGSGNWHSILRIGLKNLSQTKHMSCGNAYGNGVYFADDIGTSISYSGRLGGSMWRNSQYSGSNFMALCEIIDRPNDFTHRGNHNRHVSQGSSRGGILVVPQEEYIMTRYFIVNPRSSSCNASQLEQKYMNKKKK